MEIQEAKRRARQGPLLLLGRRAFAVLIGLATTIWIARLVPPQAYGLANMSAVLLSFAQVFRDFGMTNAVLRKGTISEEEMSFIFWFNAAATTALTLVIALISPAASKFYHEPIVVSVILTSLVGFWVSGMSLQHRALMNRELRFAEMAWIDSASLMAGFISSLVLASIWHNVWAIVLGTVVQSITGAVLYMLLSGWRPARPHIHDDIGDLLKFGANSSVFSISVFFSSNAAPILVGHLLGAWSLGQFNRAQALFTLPTVNLIQPIAQATMPLLTRLRGDPEEYRLAYLGLVARICTILMPASVVLTGCSVNLVEVLLGTRWHMAGAILTALAPSLFAVGLGYSIGDLFTTQNRSAELRTLGLAEMMLRLLLIGVGVRYGLLGAAVGFSLSSALVAVMRLRVAGRTGPVTSRNQLRAAASGVPLGIGAALGMALTAVIAPPELSKGAMLLAQIAFSAICALLAGLAIPGSRASLSDIARSFGLHRLVKRRRLTLPA